MRCRCCQQPGHRGLGKPKGLRMLGSRLSPVLGKTLMVSCPRCGTTFAADAAESMMAMGIVSFAACPACDHEFLPFRDAGGAGDQAMQRPKGRPAGATSGYGELSEDDRRQILALVRSVAGVEPQGVRIIRSLGGEIQVLTGNGAGRHGLRARSVMVERVGGGWRVKQIASWIE